MHDVTDFDNADGAQRSGQHIGQRENHICKTDNAQVGNAFGEHVGVIVEQTQDLRGEQQRRDKQDG